MRAGTRATHSEFNQSWNRCTSCRSGSWQMIRRCHLPMANGLSIGCAIEDRDPDLTHW
jgi:hypothetical protein